jgi:hypothetical protein
MLGRIITSRSLAKQRLSMRLEPCGMQWAHWTTLILL